MKQVGLMSSVGLVCVIFVLLLNGCISASSTPVPRFYMLQAIGENDVSQKFNVPSGVIIGVGPVKVPEYQNRPQIVAQDKNKMVTFAQFDRWGEPLELGLTRLFGVNLTAMLPGATIEINPWNIAVQVKYQVLINILQLESELDKDMFFVVQWSVLDVPNKKIVLIKRSEFRQPIKPQSYAGLAKTLSSQCASLSSEIAEAVASLANQPETKSGAPVPADSKNP